MTELRPVLPGPDIKAMPWANEHTDAKAEAASVADACERLDAKLTQALSENQSLRERAERAELAAADPLTALANALEPIVEYQRELHAINVALKGRIAELETAEAVIAAAVAWDDRVWNGEDDPLGIVAKDLAKAVAQYLDGLYP